MPNIQTRTTRAQCVRRLTLRFFLSNGEEHTKILNLSSPAREGREMLKRWQEFLSVRHRDSPLRRLIREVSESGACRAVLRATFEENQVGVAEPKPCFPEKSWDQDSPPKTAWPSPRAYPSTYGGKLTPSENLVSDRWKCGGYRQYYVAENNSGERTWVYREPEKRQWFLHGTFD